MQPSRSLRANVILPRKSSRDELIESLAVSLLSVRNARGLRVIVPDPMRYATMIADDLLGGRPTDTVPQ